MPQRGGRIYVRCSVYFACSTPVNNLFHYGNFVIVVIVVCVFIVIAKVTSSPSHFSMTSVDGKGEGVGAHWALNIS